MNSSNDVIWIACVQEMAARRDPLRLRAHLWATANVLGMIPVLGSEGGISGNHPAILVNPRSLVITDEGPPPRAPGHDPAWCEAVLWPSPETAIRVYSVHLPPSSAVRQLGHAQQLANRIAQRGELAIAAGDWNCYPPDPPLAAIDMADAAARPEPGLRPEGRRRQRPPDDHDHARAERTRRRSSTRIPAMTRDGSQALLVSQ